MRIDKERKSKTWIVLSEENDLARLFALDLKLDVALYMLLNVFIGA